MGESFKNKQMRKEGLMGPHDGVGDIVSDAAEAGLVAPPVYVIHLSEPAYLHALATGELPEEAPVRPLRGRGKAKS